MNKHQADYRVYYEDTDAGGVMYHANHIKFCERGRTEFLRSLGAQNLDLFKESGILFVVRKIEADYFGPARLEDLLTVQTSLSSVKNSSFWMDQEIWLESGKIYSQKVLLVCVDVQGKPVALPSELKNLFISQISPSEDPS